MQIVIDTDDLKSKANRRLGNVLHRAQKVSERVAVACEEARHSKPVSKFEAKSQQILDECDNNPGLVMLRRYPSLREHFEGIEGLDMEDIA